MTPGPQGPDPDSLAGAGKKRVVFLINPGAGQRAAAKIRSLAPTAFGQGEWRLEYVDLAHWSQIQPLAQAAAAEGAWAVVAVGGDGTVNQVAQALRGTPCRLGLIPAGTGNGFARALGIPLGAEGACAVIARAQSRPVDFAGMDGRRGFANILGVGYDAWIARSANELRWMNRFSGFLRYFVAGLLCLPKARPQRVRLTMDGGAVLEGRYQVVAVANSPQYGFGCTIAPDAVMDDGLLDVVCLRPVGPIAFVRNFVRLFTKKPLIGAQFHRCRSVLLESMEGHELAVHTDGEPGGMTPVSVDLFPGALQVLAPDRAPVLPRPSA